MSSVRPQSAVTSQKAVPPLNLTDLPQQTGVRSRRSSTRPATASHTARSSLTRASFAESTDETTLHRNAVAFFDTYHKDDLKEVIAQTTASWLLSSDFRVNTLPLNGMMSSLKLSQDPHVTILLPKKKNIPSFEYREIHQIIRDLTVGIFALNQMPSLSFEPNFDSSTSCQLPLAYKNTTVGQILISLDYKMKSLWHGATVPDKKRSTLAERWRSFVDMDKATGQVNKKNAFQEFTVAGQYYLNEDEKYAGIYKELNEVDPNEFVAKRENEFFNSYSEFFRCMMNFHIDSVQAASESNVLTFQSNFDIESQILAPEEKIEFSSQQRIRRRLRLQMEVIRKSLELDPDTCRLIELVKLISFLSPLLAAMRKRMMRIPDVDSMLSRVSSEAIQTDNQIPPFAFGDDKGRPCLTFSGPGVTHTHGGISFDVETTEIEKFANEELCDEIQNQAAEHLRHIFEEEPKRQQYIVPTTNLDDKEYFMLHIPLTTYYSASPPQPGWLHSMYKELAVLRPKRLPMSDLQILELFKQIFGFKKAFANKGVEAGLKMCSCRGLIAPFIALMRKVNTNALFSPDLQGMTLVHYAAMYNHPEILSLLLNQRLSVNVRRTAVRVKSDKRMSSVGNKTEELDERTGLSPLHYAARSGSTESCTLLLACKANAILSDEHGWSAVHHAAHCGHVSVLRVLLRKKQRLLELPATGGDCSTPFLLAASGGSVNCVDFLLKMGAKHDITDSTGNTAVHRATLNFHTPVLEYFIRRLNQNPPVKSLPVWDIVVGMLKSSSVKRQDAALRCLEMLLHRTPAYWSDLLSAGAVLPLVSLLNSDKKIKASDNLSTSHCDSVVPIRSLACSVICLMSENDKVRREVTSAGAITTLIELLSPNGESAASVICELQSRSSVVLSDLACVDDNAAKIAKHGGILPLVNLLQHDVVDVLVNAVNTIRSLCQGDIEGDNQRQVVECGAVQPLVELLHVREDVLSSAVAAAIAEICRYNREIQDIFLDADVLRPLVAMLRRRNFNSKVQAAKAVESISYDNEDAQQLAEQQEVPEALCTMFQAMAEPVKERGACAIWALAGEHPEQQRRIAGQIGLRQMKDMLSSKSDALQLVGCQAIAATAYMSSSGQRELSEYDDMISNLIRLLRLNITKRPVVTAVIHAISNLCVGVAHQNNKYVQQILSEYGAIELLAQRVWECTHDECLQVELLYCLACSVVGCPENEEQLNQLDTFGLEIILELLNSFNQRVRQRAAMSLAIFAFNRPSQQKKILKLGGLTILTFEDLLSSHDHETKAEAAFQMVILAKVIVDSTLVEVSAQGILILVELLNSNNKRVLMVTAQCITSLSHTRAGVSDALVTSGVVPKLLKILLSDSDVVRLASAQALGYLSFNRVASRELISACRSREGLYEAIVNNLGEDGKISEEFEAEYKRQCAVGLPITKKRPPSASAPRRPMSSMFCGDDRKNKGRSRQDKSRMKRSQRIGISLRSRSLSPAVLVTESPR
ncbi:ankyrin and armadillo repeat-containing protein-like isoform X1 [Styela clava]